jgi:hypothetical protein
MNSSTCCLVVVFNHNHSQNVPLLRRLYGSRFSHLLFLMPFCRDPQKDIIPVCESAYFFQGYLWQAHDRLLHEDCTHYVVIGDDLLLNPRLSETTIIDELGLNGESGYIKQLKSCSDVPLQWLMRYGNLLDQHLIPAHVFGSRQLLPPLSKYRKDVQFKNALPDKELAEGLLRRHGVEIKPLGLRNMVGFDGMVRYFPGITRALIHALCKSKIPYPLAFGYSDFFIVPKLSFEAFCFYCGVFAAMNLFVELAVPTSLALAVASISTERETRWRGVEVWRPKARAELERRTSDTSRSLDAFFEPNQLYLHPVKLSRLAGSNA